ncbi:MAG: hypothetical protein JEZ06_00315 [Anaerolineaceae bacterium]|nr:hypothetical protein [Anaerolineaceae bacterium]
MTKRRKWPHEAEWARNDTVVRMERIEGLASSLIFAEGLSGMQIVRTAAKIKELANVSKHALRDCKQVRQSL